MKNGEKTEDLGMLLEEVKLEILSRNLNDIEEIDFIIFNVIKCLFKIIKQDQNIYALSKKIDKFETTTKMSIIDIRKLIEEIEKFTGKTKFQYEILKTLKSNLRKFKKENNLQEYILIIDILINIVDLENRKTERFESYINPNTHENWIDKYMNNNIDSDLYIIIQEDIENNLTKIKIK